MNSFAFYFQLYTIKDFILHEFHGEIKMLRIETLVEHYNVKNF